LHGKDTRKNVNLITALLHRHEMNRSPYIACCIVFSTGPSQQTDYNNWLLKIIILRQIRPAIHSYLLHTSTSLYYLAMGC